MDDSTPAPPPMGLPVLDAMEQRVLGSLLEKEVTVPASYPLTLNALRIACNQATSRDPVTDYDDNTLVEVTLRLQRRQLLRLTRADSRALSVKYQQRLSEQLGLGQEERALVTVLLLRGAQAPGELKARTERLHPFADRAEVEAALARMAAAPTPLARELERLPGQHDRRWIHVLGPVEVTAEPSPPAAGASTPREDLPLDQPLNAPQDQPLNAPQGQSGPFYLLVEQATGAGGWLAWSVQSPPIRLGPALTRQQARQQALQHVQRLDPDPPVLPPQERTVLELTPDCFLAVVEGRDETRCLRVTVAGAVSGPAS